MNECFFFFRKRRTRSRCGVRSSRTSVSLQQRVHYRNDQTVQETMTIKVLFTLRHLNWYFWSLALLHSVTQNRVPLLEKNIQNIYVKRTDSSIFSSTVNPAFNSVSWFDQRQYVLVPVVVPSLSAARSQVRPKRGQFTVVSGEIREKTLRQTQRSHDTFKQVQVRTTVTLTCSC